jgi:hypothetical protein
MALAYLKSDNAERANVILREVAKSHVIELSRPTLKGIPYATNQGTGYGNGLLWSNVDARPATAACCWFVMACNEFDPMRLNYSKSVPSNLLFW